MDIIYKRVPQQKSLVQRDKQSADHARFGADAKECRFVRLAHMHKGRRHNTQNLSVRGVRSSFFVTEDSRRYISQVQAVQSARGMRYRDTRGHVDSLSGRYVTRVSFAVHMHTRAAHDFAHVRDRLFALRKMRQWHFSPVRMWQFSMVGAMLFGMITMSMVYKNLGQSAFAKDIATTHAHTLDPFAAMILEGGTAAITEEKPATTEDTGTIGELSLADDVPEKSADQLAFEKRATELVEGYPIENMLPYIFKQDREVAIYLIAIAKQESAWGKRKPVLNGQDCYNYWGYRAQRARMGSGGHTCFESPEDAVLTVGKRIHSLIYDYNRATPSDLTVWKCGYSCAGHTQESVARWINTVTLYRDKLKRD